MSEKGQDDMDLATALADFRRRSPADVGVVEQFAALLRSGGADPFRRTRLEGHFTGSAWVVSADGTRTLLLHHAKLGRWLQPGGHADGSGDLAAVALREAQEETGLRGLRVEGGVFDLDRHRIPARGHEPEHWHYDVRFVVRASADEAFTVNEESRGMAWRNVREVADDPAMDDSVRRMAAKWLKRALRIRPSRSRPRSSRRC